uniref:adenylate cyclase n=1 Tax=Tetraodon nigroviridis TaxID=99883 RepID=H3DRB5_TETNG
MASPQRQQLLPRNTEVSCDSSGDGGVSVKIGSSVKNKGSKHCKYSISSSCSSGESGARRPVVKSFRTHKKMPQLFERSAGHFWDPKFDSSILEEACRERCFPQTQRRFRYVLLYLVAAGLLWGLYFALSPSRCDWTAFLLPTALFLFFCLLLFLLTFTKLYAHCYNQASLLLILVTFLLTLAPQIQTSSFREPEASPPDLNLEDLSGMEPSYNLSHDNSNGGGSWSPCLSPIGTFSLCIEVLMLLYSVLHVRLYASVLLGFLYSVFFETLGWLHLTRAGENWAFVSQSDWDTLNWLGLAKALLHLCAHAIGIHLFIMSEVRSRSTFLKVGQAIMHGKDLEVEKALKERMIHSVMPRIVADELMKQGDEEMGDNSVKRYSTSGAAAAISSPKNNKRKKTSIPRGQIIFRPFNMKRMEPVSILFADIVGFTKMSANKSAHALVGLLNDLFGRFDRLCELTGCEKISTLGDCYYCVAGCPEPRADHAYCCVEMGLGMIQAIEQFCQEKREMVNMRVGVHTGTVLCGILGMKRFKFDVWSNDVNLANLMEQLGVAGKVHLSQATANFLDDRYQQESGQVFERIGQSVVADQLKGIQLQSASGPDLLLPLWSCNRTGAPCRFILIISTPTLHPRSAGGAYTQDTHSHSLCSCRLPRSQPHPVQVCELCGDLHSVYVCNKGISKRNSDERKVKGICIQGSLSDASSRFAERSPDSSCADEAGDISLLLFTVLRDRCGAAEDVSMIMNWEQNSIMRQNDAVFTAVIGCNSRIPAQCFWKHPGIVLFMHFVNGAKMTSRASLQTSAVDLWCSAVAVMTLSSECFCCLHYLLLNTSLLIIYLIVKHYMSPQLHVARCASIGLYELKFVCCKNVFFPVNPSIKHVFGMEMKLVCVTRFLAYREGWMPCHLIGAVLVSLPTVAVLSHITCEIQLSIEFTMFICCAVIIVIIQYCNFCQLSYWMRSTLATLVGLALLAFLFFSPC